MKRFVLILVVLLAWLCAGASPGLAEKIYWTAGNKIQRANLDGTNVEDVVVWDFAGFHGIALDTTARFDSATGQQINTRFGEFIAARNPRQMQFALRFFF